MPVRLIVDDPEWSWVIIDRTDGGDILVHDGETFEVEDKRATFLLSRYFPRLKPA